MSLPEISRRCVSCGAAVRSNARFCPQCGKSVPEGTVSESSADALASATLEEPAPATRDVEAPQASTPSTRDVYVAAPESEPSPSRVAEVSTPLEVSKPSSVPETGERRAFSDLGAVEASEARAPSALPTQTTPEESASAEERRGRVARVREEARVRVENTRARVERVRDDALVALEETPDDSGLRFVLVTVFLFVLFLFFLLLSVTVLR